jgi:hypothetical protein
MENAVLLKKTARGDKDKIRLIVGGIGDELFSLWNDAFFLLHEQYKSTGKILTAPKLSAAVTQKFYTKKNQHPDLDGNDPLPERIASEIIRLYKEIFKEELRPT